MKQSHNMDTSLRGFEKDAAIPTGYALLMNYQVALLFAMTNAIMTSRGIRSINSITNNIKKPLKLPAISYN